MDWSKAKTILIIALFITNVVLAAYLYMDRSGGAEPDEVALQEILEGRNIFIDAEIPEYPAKLAVLFVEYDEMDEDKVKHAIDAAPAIKGKNRTDEALAEGAEKLLEASGLMSKNVMFHRIYEVDGKTRICFRNIYEDIPIEENQMVCILEEDRFTGVERSWYTPTGVNKKKKKITAPIIALMQFMPDKEKSEEIHINSLELVYWLDPESFDGEEAITDTALPAWKINYGDGQVKYIHAFED